MEFSTCPLITQAPFEGHSHLASGVGPEFIPRSLTESPVEVLVERDVFFFLKVFILQTQNVYILMVEFQNLWQGLSLHTLNHTI